MQISIKPLPASLWKLLLCIVLVVTLFTPTFAEASSGQRATLVEMNGDVWVTKGGGKREIKAFNGMGLTQGDTIRTGRGAYARIEFDQDNAVSLAQNTTITLAELAEKQGVNSAKVKQSSGGLWSKVKRSVGAGDTYEVETPTSIMGVRGTMFLTQFDNGRTFLSVLDGIVGMRGNQGSASRDQTMDTETLLYYFEQLHEGDDLPEPTDLDLENLNNDIDIDILIDMIHDAMEAAQQALEDSEHALEQLREREQAEHLLRARQEAARAVYLNLLADQMMRSDRPEERDTELQRRLEERNRQTQEQLEERSRQQRERAEQAQDQAEQAANEAREALEEARDQALNERLNRLDDVNQRLEERRQQQEGTTSTPSSGSGGGGGSGGDSNDGEATPEPAIDGDSNVDYIIGSEKDVIFHLNLDGDELVGITNTTISEEYGIRNLQKNEDYHLVDNQLIIYAHYLDITNMELGKEEAQLDLTFASGKVLQVSITFVPSGLPEQTGTVTGSIFKLVMPFLCEESEEPCWYLPNPVVYETVRIISASSDDVLGEAANDITDNYFEVNNILANTDFFIEVTIIDEENYENKTTFRSSQKYSVSNGEISNINLLLEQIGQENVAREIGTISDLRVVDPTSQPIVISWDPYDEADKYNVFVTVLSAEPVGPNEPGEPGGLDVPWYEFGDTNDASYEVNTELEKEHLALVMALDGNKEIIAFDYTFFKPEIIQQTGTVTGVVYGYDAWLNEPTIPLEGIKITAWDEEIKEDLDESITGEDGQYEIQIPINTPYRITAQYPVDDVVFENYWDDNNDSFQACADILIFAELYPCNISNEDYYRVLIESPMVFDDFNFLLMDRVKGINYERDDNAITINWDWASDFEYHEQSEDRYKVFILKNGNEIESESDEIRTDSEAGITFEDLNLKSEHDYSIRVVYLKTSDNIPVAVGGKSINP